MNTMVAKKNLTDEEKKKIIQEALGKDYDIAGRNYPVLSKVIDYIGYADNTFTIIELLPMVESVMASSTIITVAASGAAIFSIVLFPVSALISVIDAYQTGHRFYSYRAIAYTITSWAFDKPILRESQRILFNIRSGPVVQNPRVVGEFAKVWKDTSDSVVRMLNQEIATGKATKEVMQIIFRALGDGNEQKLCDLFLRGFENNLSPIEKITWKSNYKIIYPN